MSHNSKPQQSHKPNFIAIGLVLGTCFMVAMQSPIYILAGVMLGIILDWRQRKSEA